MIVKDVSGNWFRPPGDLYDGSGNILTQLNIFINGFDFGPLKHEENDCVQQNIDQDIVGEHWYDVSGCKSNSNFQMDITDKNTHLNSVSAWDPSSNWTESILLLLMLQAMMIIYIVLFLSMVKI